MFSLPVIIKAIVGVVSKGVVNVSVGLEDRIGLREFNKTPWS